MQITGQNKNTWIRCKWLIGWVFPRSPLTDFIVWSDGIVHEELSSVHLLNWTPFFFGVIQAVCNRGTELCSSLVQWCKYEWRFYLIFFWDDFSIDLTCGKHDWCLLYFCSNIIRPRLHLQFLGQACCHGGKDGGVINITVAAPFTRLPLCCDW